MVSEGGITSGSGRGSRCSKATDDMLKAGGVTGRSEMGSVSSEMMVDMLSDGGVESISKGSIFSECTSEMLRLWGGGRMGVGTSPILGGEVGGDGNWANLDSKSVSFCTLASL